MSTRSAMVCMLVLIPVGASAQGTTMTKEDFSDAARRGVNLAQALEARFPGIRAVGRSLSGWCVEYRQVGASGRCKSLAVFVDGIRIGDPRHFFASQPVEDIVRAELLSAMDATIRYGSTAGWGALVIETRRGSLP